MFLPRHLGSTNLRVSALSLGTVELGLDYGFTASGKAERPSEAEAAALLERAVEAGVNLFDTAPAYGGSERLLGRVLGRRSDVLVATKVETPREGKGQALNEAVAASLTASLKNLGRQSLDIVQLHNATVEVLAGGEMAAALLKAREEGLVRFLGATVYTEAEALAAVDSGWVEILQVPYSLLNQQMARRVFAAAQRAGLGLVVRSVFLQGVLTPRAEHLPPQLAPLRLAAQRAKDALAGSWAALPGMALRFALSAPGVGAVLIGVSSLAELNEALEAASAGPLPRDHLAQSAALALGDEALLNPSSWDAPA